MAVLDWPGNSSAIASSTIRLLLPYNILLNKINFI